MLNVRKLQSLVEERVQQLVKRLRTSNKVITLNLAYVAFTNNKFECLLSIDAASSFTRKLAKFSARYYHEVLL